MSESVGERVLARLGEAAALLLWDSGGIKINLAEPFKLVSGNYSPIYVNCRAAISDAVFMRLFVVAAGAIWRQHGLRADVIAGGETAGIPFAAYVAQSLALPMVYVRKATKDHGIAGLVEGRLKEGARVLLVEDLITDGGSKMGFIDGLGDAGGVVEHVLVLFDRLQGGRQALAVRGIGLHSVTDIDSAMAVAARENLLTDAQVAAVKEYIASPEDWHRRQGLQWNRGGES